MEQLQPHSLVPLVLYALSAGSLTEERAFPSALRHTACGEIFRVAGDLTRWLEHHYGLAKPIHLVEPGREISLALNAPDLAARLAANRRGVQRAVTERRVAYS